MMKSQREYQLTICESFCKMAWRREHGMNRAMRQALCALQKIDFPTIQNIYGAA